MGQQTRIELEKARQLHGTQELALLRKAYDRKPTPALRVSLASLLIQFDAFDAAVDLLADHSGLDYRESMYLAQAYLSLEDRTSAAEAIVACDRAFSLAETGRGRAEALALRGKAETRRGDSETARTTLRAALLLDPHNKEACKRLSALELANDGAEAVIALTDELAAHGATHARLFVARGLAQAHLGAAAAARATLAFDPLHHAEVLPPPPGWSDIHSFNAALALELLAHPGLRYERYGTASKLTWRIDAPATPDAPLTRLVLDQIKAALAAQIERIADIDHPWARARPDAATLHSWSVITDHDGHEVWHLHPLGWMSGVYYVQIPHSIAHGAENGGCLAFGLPDELVGPQAAADYGTRMVRPHDGLLLAFPSHSYHRTFPHGLNEKRICLAFDLRPD